jgi:hypothetical protein
VAHHRVDDRRPHPHHPDAPLAAGGGVSGRLNLDGVAAELRARGVIAADAAPLPDRAVDRPWFIVLLQGAAGWLAGIFLLIFLGLIFKPDSSGSILLLGVLLLGAAWALYFADRDAVFLDQLALAISIAGQVAITLSAVKDAKSALPISAALFGLQLLVFLVMPNKTARTLAALFACMAWVYTIRFLMAPGSGEAIFFGEDPSGAAPLFGHITGAIAWGLRWLPLVGLAWSLLRRESRWMAGPLRGFARPALTGVLLALSAGVLISDAIMPLVGQSDVVGAPVNWAALFPLLSIATALYAAWCAFQLRSLGLLGFAVVGALAQLSRFYYFYGTTLMWKSAIMLVLGAAMIVAGVTLQRRVAPAGSAA